MNIDIIRQAELAKSFWLTSEIELTKALNQRGMKASLIVIGNRKKDTPDFIIEIPAYMNRAVFFRLRLLIMLFIKIIRGKTDLLILDRHTVLISLPLLLLKRFYGFKIILDLRTVPVEEQKEDTKFQLSLKIADRYFDGISFITEGTRRYLSNKYKIQFKHTLIIGSAVNIELFCNNRAAVLKEVKDKYIKRFTLFYHGSISKNRGIDHVLLSLNNLKTIIPELLFISVSNNNNYIRNFCTKNNLSMDDHLYLIDSVSNDQIPNYIALADVCIVPLPRLLWWEISSPLKLMEYLAMGKPVILSDIEAHLQIIEESCSSAVFFNPDVDGDLTSKILYAFKQIKELNSFDNRTIILEKKYTWTDQADKLLQFVNL